MPNISIEDLEMWQAAVQSVTRLSDKSYDVVERHTNDVCSYREPEWMPRVHDLHGLTVEAAYRYMVDLMNELSNHAYKQVRIITGKSGQIRQEFPTWMNTRVFLPKIKRIQLEASGGSYLITINR